MFKVGQTKIKSLSEYLLPKISEKKLAEAIGLAISNERFRNRLWAAIRPFVFFSFSLLIFAGVFVLVNWPAISQKLRYNIDSVQEKDQLVTEALIQDILSSKKLNIAKETPSPIQTQAVEAPPQIQDNRLLVPKIGVDAPIIFIESDNEKDLLAALKKGVIHYPHTGTPDTISNTVLTGHSSNYWWETGEYNYVFALLPDLQPGDQAIIYYQKKKYVYMMSDSIVVDPRSVEPYLQNTGKPMLTLITCVPVGTAWKRIIVRFDLIEAPVPDIGGATVPLPKLRPVWQDLVDEAWREFSKRFVLQK